MFAAALPPCHGIAYRSNYSPDAALTSPGRCLPTLWFHSGSVKPLDPTPSPPCRFTGQTFTCRPSKLQAVLSLHIFRTRPHTNSLSSKLSDTYLVTILRSVAVLDVIERRETPSLTFAVVFAASKMIF
jgi:hypothetical protein